MYDVHMYVGMFFSYVRRYVDIKQAVIYNKHSTHTHVYIVEFENREKKIFLFCNDCNDREFKILKRK